MRPIAVLAVMLSLLPLPSIAAEEEKEWIDYARPDDGFMVNFPGEPRIETTTYESEYGAKLPARIYRAEDGHSRFSLTVVDYRPAERLLTENAKACPRGSERCVGTPGAGAGYWRLDKRGALVYASKQFLQRDAKVTYFWQDAPSMIETLRIQLANADGTKTYASVVMHKDILYITEGTGPADDITPHLFAQGMRLINEQGQGVTYPDFYSNAWPAPPPPPPGFRLADPDVIYRQLHPDAEPLPPPQQP